jgi:mono/diheme cytochrome c family protein
MQLEYRAVATKIGSRYLKQVIGLFRGSSPLAKSHRSKKRGCFCAWAAIGIAAAFALAGCRSKAALTPQEAEGKHLYEVRCAHCHEENDLGLKKAPPNLHNIFGSARLPSGAPISDVEVLKMVVNGKGMMPAFAGRFTDEQLSDLLSYLHWGVS